MNSKTLIKQTNILNDYLFEKIEINKEVKKENKGNNIFSLINYNDKDNNKKEINNMNEKQKLKDINDIFENNNNEVNLNITEILSNGNSLLCGNKYLYSCSSDNNKLEKIHEFKDKENDKNECINLLMNGDDNNIIFKNIINLKRSLSSIYNNYHILLWKFENDLEKDNLFNLINNKKKEDKEKENKKDEESRKCENRNINNYNNSERNNLIQPNNNNIDNNNELNQCLLINVTNNYENNSNRNTNNIFGNSTYDSYNIFNMNYNSYSNIFRNKEEEEEEYVYISRTGAKYHGYPTCGIIIHNNTLFNIGFQLWNHSITLIF